MNPNDGKKELIDSIQEVPGGSNDNLWPAIAVAATVAIVGTIIRVALGITGGLAAAIPAILAYLVFRAMRKSRNGA